MQSHEKEEEKEEEEKVPGTPPGRCSIGATAQQQQAYALVVGPDKSSLVRSLSLSLEDV
jgi:hypothetical protein